MESVFPFFPLLVRGPTAALPFCSHVFAVLSLFCFETSSHSVVLAGLELTMQIVHPGLKLIEISLLLPPKCRSKACTTVLALSFRFTKTPFFFLSVTASHYVCSPGWPQICNLPAYAQLAWYSLCVCVRCVCTHTCGNHVGVIPQVLSTLKIYLFLYVSVCLSAWVCTTLVEEQPEVRRGQSYGQS